MQCERVKHLLSRLSKLFQIADNSNSFNGTSNGVGHSGHEKYVVKFHL